jgi:hypothetical protein
MSCGCKNKNNGTQAQPAQSAQPSQAQQVKSPTIQESIKKVVEKYYNKKKSCYIIRIKEGYPSFFLSSI